MAILKKKNNKSNATITITKSAYLDCKYAKVYRFTSDAALNHTYDKLEISYNLGSTWENIPRSSTSTYYAEFIHLPKLNSAYRLRFSYRSTSDTTTKTSTFNESAISNTTDIVFWKNEAISSSTYEKVELVLNCFSNPSQAFKLNKKNNEEKVKVIGERRPRIYKDTLYDYDISIQATIPSTDYDNVIKVSEQIYPITLQNPDGYFSFVSVGDVNYEKKGNYSYDITISCSEVME